MDVDGEEIPQDTSVPANPRNFSDFLKLPQEPPRRRNARKEPIVGYS